MAAADHARFAALRQRRGQRRDLTGLLALMTGDRAGQRVEQKVLAMLADALREIVVSKRGGEFRQCLCRFHGHIRSPSARIGPGEA